MLKFQTGYTSLHSYQQCVNFPSFPHDHQHYLFDDSHYNRSLLNILKELPYISDGKESACNAGDLGSIPGSGRSPGEVNGNPFQHFCQDNPMDRAA